MVIFVGVSRHRPALDVDDDRGELPEFPFEHSERLLPLERQRVVFPGRLLAGFDPLGLDKPFLGQTAEDQMKKRTKAWTMNSRSNIVNGYTVIKAIDTSSDVGAREFA